MSLSSTMNIFWLVTCTSRRHAPYTVTWLFWIFLILWCWWVIQYRTAQDFWKKKKEGSVFHRETLVCGHLDHLVSRIDYFYLLYKSVFSLVFCPSEAGRTHAAIHSWSQHHQPRVCSLGPGGGDRLHHPGPVHWSLRRKPSQQESPFSHPQENRSLPLQQLQPRYVAPRHTATTSGGYRSLKYQ